MKIIVNIALAALLSLTSLVSLIPGRVHAVSTSLVISQVQTRSTTSVSHELIEIYNNANAEIDVTNWCVRYSSANSESASRSICFTPTVAGAENRIVLPAHATVVMASTPPAGPEFVVDYTFAAGMSDTGGRVAVFDEAGIIIDAVAWGSSPVTAEGNQSAPALSNTNPTTLLERKVLSSNVLQDTDNNAADFVIATPRTTYTSGALIEELDYCLNILGLQAVVPDGFVRQSDGMCVEAMTRMPDICGGVILSELLPNPAGADGSNEFIELYNPSEESISLAGCSIALTGGRSYAFTTEQVIAPKEYKAFYDNTTKLTLPNAAGAEIVLTTQGEEIAVQYPGGLKDDEAWALIDGTWQVTGLPTPNAENQLVVRAGKGASSELAACPAGKFRNPATNRCKNIESGSSLVPCKAGQVRNPDTNRCRSIAAGSTTLVPCKPGQERNPATNRCRSVAGANSLVPCKEGYERNPETNRCRKASGTAAGALSNTAVAQTPVNYPAIATISVAALGYGLYEYRQELAEFLRKFWRALLRK